MNSPRRYLAFAASLFVSAALLASACGGDDDDSAGGSSGDSASRSSSGAPAAQESTGGGEKSMTDSLAPAGGSTAQETDGQEALPFDRKIIFTTAIDVSVPDVTSSFNDVQRIARVAGGYVEKSNLSVISGSDAKRATVTLRVPADEYDNTLNSLRTLSGATVSREEAKSNEVTEQYVDLQSRLRNLESNEAQYLTLLAQAKTIDEIMKVNDRLSAVRSQIEQAKGRLNVLDHMTEMATIDVSLAPIAPAKVDAPKSDRSISSPAEAFGGALAFSADALRVLAAVGAVAVVGLGWLVPVGAVAFFGRRYVRNRRPSAVPMPHDAPMGPPAPQI